MLVVLNTENARIAKENENFRRIFVLNNAMLLENKDNPAYIRQQIAEIYSDFSKAVGSSGAFISEGLDKLESIVNEKL